jgi:hypothetical protein
MAVDLSKIKPGDEVLVRCVVRERGSAARNIFHCLTVSDADQELSSSFMVLGDEIAAVTPKALAVGDRVKVGAEMPDDFLWTGRVVRLAAIDGKHAWLASDEGDHLTIDPERLERVND